MSKNFSTQLETLLKSNASSGLSASEKAKMRMQLGSFIDRNPVHASRFDFLARLSGRLFQLRPLLASLTVVLLFSGASLASAQSALPGDTLYDLKLFVNEDVPMAFMNDEEKQDFVLKQVDNRLEEAEQLKEKGKLSSEHEAVLQSKFDQYFEKLSKSEHPAKISKDLNTVLGQHQEVLPQFTVLMDDEENVDTDHKPGKGKPFKNMKSMTLKDFFEATHKSMEELEQEEEKKQDPESTEVWTESVLSTDTTESIDSTGTSETSDPIFLETGVGVSIGTPI